MYGRVEREGLVTSCLSLSRLSLSLAGGNCLRPDRVTTEPSGKSLLAVSVTCHTHTLTLSLTHTHKLETRKQGKPLYIRNKAFFPKSNP